MRKSTFLTLSLLILTITTTVIFGFRIYKTHDQVIVTEETLYGDSSKAEGVMVSLQSTYAYHILWTLDYTYSENPICKTDYNFSSNTVVPSNIRHDGITLSASPNAEIYLNREQQFNALDTYCMEIYNQLEPASGVGSTIYLKDYLDYYPIYVALDFPEMYAGSYERNLEEELLSNPDSTDYAMKKIMDYFKIPVLEHQQVHVNVFKGSNDRIAVQPDIRDDNIYDSYQMTTYSLLTDKGCYFTFDTHSFQGNIVDISHLPEGYGLYFLPYKTETSTDLKHDVSTVDADALDMVYSLDPEITVLQFDVNEEYSELLLYTTENEKDYLTVIDIETMEMLEKLELQNFSYGTFYTNNHNTIVFLDELTLTLYHRDGNNHYEFQFSCDRYPDLIGYSGMHARDIAYDGQCLVIVNQDVGEDRFNYDGSFSLAVYEKNGLCYLGKFRSSLMDVANIENYGYYYTASNTINDSIKVEWEK